MLPLVHSFPRLAYKTAHWIFSIAPAFLAAVATPVLMRVL